MTGGPIEEAIAEQEGGDPACWAHLICPQCGAPTGDVHASTCALGAHDPLPDTDAAPR